MKPRAIVSFLWAKNANVISRFLSEHPDVSLLAAPGWTDELLAGLMPQFPGRIYDMGALLQPGDTLEMEVFIRSASTNLDSLAGDLGFANFARSLELEELRFLDEIKELSAQQIPLVAQLLFLLRKAEQIFDISLLVLSEDVTLLGRTATAWSKAHSIPSMVLTHGVLLSAAYTVHKGLYADVAAVYGPRGAETYLDIGVDPGRIRVTGNPDWDVYANQSSRKAEVREMLCGQYKLDTNRQLVVFATTWAASLTAHSDANIYSETIEQFLAAMSALKQKAINAQIVIKDRGANIEFGEGVVNSLFAKYGFSNTEAIYVTGSPQPWVIAADVLVAVDSNISIEALIAATPSINLLNDFGLIIGPSFDADSGVMEVGPDELAASVEMLLFNETVKQDLVERGKRNLSYYNEGVDGNATVRVANLMSQLMRAAESEEKPVWQRYLNVSDIDATGYHGHARTELFAQALHPPRVMLDIGCGAGATGAWVKQTFPGAVAYGIEINRSAANIAAQLIDKVWSCKFEEVDFEKDGIKKGSIDTVVVADVLEHMYNPWDVLVQLKPWLSPDAQILASIPNVRNLLLMQDLAQGYWKYESEGLLDVTHIRFFTLKEIKKFFFETGYHLNALRYGIDHRLADFFNQNYQKGVVDIDLGRMVLKKVGSEELQELCTLQFFCVASLGANHEDIQDYSTKQVVQIGNDYLAWLDRLQLGKVEGELYEQRLKAQGATARVHIVIQAVGADCSNRLMRTMNSLSKLAYDDVVVTVFSDMDLPSELSASERFRWASYTGNPLTAINECGMSDTDSRWLAFISAGDLLAPHALLSLVERAESGAYKMIYSDEDFIVGEGVFDKPNFKPDFNLDYLRSYPYVGGLLLISSEVFNRLEGFENRWLGAEQYDLLLRCVEVFALDSIGHVADILLHRQSTLNPWGVDENTVIEYQKLALQHHLDRLGLKAFVADGLYSGSFKVNYALDDQPLVSILIPVCSNVSKLSRCVESILERTDYQHFEILIGANDPEDSRLLAYLNQINDLKDPKIRVIYDNDSKALPGVYNVLAKFATGSYLVLFQPDNAVVYADWLETLLGYAQRQEVGMVSPRLVDSRYRIRGAGYIAGLNGVAQALFSDQLLDHEGYGGRAKLTQNFTALPSGCLVLKKVIFDAAGGFDEEKYPWSYYEVDLAWRIYQAGLLNVWTPSVSILAEQESLDDNWTLVRFHEGEREKLQKQAETNLYGQWIKLMGCDPYYNKNLRLTGEPFKIDMRTALSFNPLPWKPLKRILAMPADLQGCGHYRIISPARHMQKLCKATTQIAMDHYTPAEIERFELDSMVMQRQLMPQQNSFIKRYREVNKDVFLVFEVDDLFTHVPVKSMHRKELPKNISALLRDSLKLFDRLVVSTQPIKEAYSDLIDDIRVVNNRIEHSIWGSLTPQRRGNKKPRVGWAGGVSHTGDLQLIADVVKETAKEVDWIFLGMYPEGTRAYISEFHEGVPLKEYPAKLASLDLDLAIAPLEMNAFNESKSNLRLLEYGVLGYPVICTDILPYQESAFPVTRVKNSLENWVTAIREHVHDRAETARMGDSLREHVLKNWLLEDHLDEWVAAWTR